MPKLHALEIWMGGGNGKGEKRGRGDGVTWGNGERRRGKWGDVQRTDG